jgi:putative N-acetylmannosamine-6-phosphate epimerase
VPCNEVQDRGIEIREDYQGCEQDDDCVLVHMTDLIPEGECIGAFQCTHGLAKDADLADLKSEAKDLAKRYERCNQCVMADCAVPNDVLCDPDTKLCQAIDTRTKAP